uniref:Uncharacterized protein n=1 Tax=Dicentrarchus labrax TaxID=13489 RepID=A0A8C4EPV0_DICLA
MGLGQRTRTNRGELDKTNARLNEVETKVAGHEDKLQSTDEILSEMISTQEKLQLKLTSLEVYSRRETLRLYGVPEGAESGPQSMTHFVEKLLWENLNIPSSTALQIQRAHRVLSSPPPDGSQPRSILVKFLCFTVKEVLRLGWQKKGFMWNKINLDHDYHLEIMAMRKEYVEVRRILKDKNMRFRNLYPALWSGAFTLQLYTKHFCLFFTYLICCFSKRGLTAGVGGMLCGQLIQLHAK